MSDSVRPHRRQPTRLPIPGILQARTLEWVSISFSNAWKWKVKVKSLSCIWLLVTPWTAAHQAPPSTGFSRQKYWSGVPLPSPFHFLLSNKSDGSNSFHSRNAHLFMMLNFFFLLQAYIIINSHAWFSNWTTTTCIIYSNILKINVGRKGKKYLPDQT